jgi:excinuclease ABC subunit C
MTLLSKQQNFEKAVILRDKIKSIEKTMAPQDLVTPYDEDADVFGLARSGGHGSVALLQVRHGRIVGKQIFSLLLPSQEKEDDVLRQFLIQYYRSAVSDTKQILLPVEIPDAPEIGKFAHPHPVVISYPKRGWKKELLKTATTNAKEALSRSETELQSPINLQKGLKDLVDNLMLQSLPKRIETYDISNIQGKLATASMVVFLDGKPAPSEYRKFKMLTKEEPNDVGMMKEVLTRRFKSSVIPAPARIAMQSVAGGSLILS